MILYNKLQKSKKGRGPSSPLGYVLSREMLQPGVCRERGDTTLHAHTYRSLQGSTNSTSQSEDVTVIYVHAYSNKESQSTTDVSVEGEIRAVVREKSSFSEVGIVMA